MSAPITLHLATYTLTGVANYDPDTRMLQLIDTATGASEVLSIDLPGIEPTTGHVFVRDYSEHHRLPEALVTAGIATITREHRTGPFQSRVMEMRVL